MKCTKYDVARTRVALGILVLAWLLAACGGSGASSSGPAPTLDSCALLTEADAVALLGAPVGAPSTDDVAGDDPQDERAVSQCLYSTSGDEYKSVSVLVRRDVAGLDARSALGRSVPARS